MVKEGDLHRLAKNAEDAEAQELHRVFAEDGPMNPDPDLPLCVRVLLASGSRATLIPEPPVRRVFCQIYPGVGLICLPPFVFCSE